jgi:signal transduction histidine kinase
MADSFGRVLNKPLIQAVMTVFVVAASFFARSSLVYLLGYELPPFIVLYPAIMTVALLCGLWSGIAGTVLGALAADYLIFPPRGRLEIASRGDAFSLLAFALMGIFMSMIAERYRRNQRLVAAVEAERVKYEAEARYHDLINTMEEGVGVFEMVFDASGHAVDFRVTEVNAAFKRQSGLVDPVGKMMREIAPTLEEFWFEFYGKVALTGEPAYVQHDSKAVQGFYDVRAYRVGKPEQRLVATVFSEISEQMRTEEALAADRTKLNVALASMTDAVLICETTGRFIQTNDAFVRFYRFANREECFSALEGLRELTDLKSSDGKVVPASDRPIPRALRGELTADVEYLFSRIDTGEIWTGSCSCSPLRDSAGVIFGAVFVARDISERKLAENHIRQLNRVYAVLSDVNQTIVREKNIREMMQSACRIAVDKGGFRMAWTGMLDPDTQLLKPVAWSGIVDGFLSGLKIDLKDPQKNSGPAGVCARTGKDSICNNIAKVESDAPWRAKALELGYRSSAAFPLRADGEVVGVFSLYAAEPGFFAGDELALLDEMAMDISHAIEVYRHDREHEKAEEELRWKTAFFEAMVESSPDCVLVIDKQGKKILQNQRLLEMLKIPPEIAQNPDFSSQIDHVMSRMKDPAKFVERVRYLSSHPDEVGLDVVEHQDGTILERYSSPVRDAKGNYYGRIWTLRDITQQRVLEEQLRQAQKIEAVGQLTGGIAHDFNNLLTVILGCAEVIGHKVMGDPQLSKMAEMVVNAAQRGADLTQRMLAFARRQALEPQAVDVHTLLKETEEFLRRTLTANIDFKVVEGEGERVAIVDPAQLENAVLNLCVNARDAMPNGGALTIETRYAELDENYAAQNPGVTPGEYILIVVSDSGSGIRSEHLERVFDPFFTTKPVGKGTGLGLSMVYGFAKQSQGHVKIYSEEGRGTSVRLYLPKAHGAGSIAIKPPEPASEARGNETVLLVEDNDSVLEFARGQLEELGYRVLVATNAKDALQTVIQRDDIDLMLTDVVMPGGMNGRELAAEAIKVRPKLSVLFSSGYAENAIAHQGILERGVPMLQKPYTRVDLARMVRRTLAAG